MGPSEVEGCHNTPGKNHHRHLEEQAWEVGWILWWSAARRYSIWEGPQGSKDYSPNQRDRDHLDMMIFPLQNFEIPSHEEQVNQLSCE